MDLVAELDVSRNQVLIRVYRAPSRIRSDRFIRDLVGFGHSPQVRYLQMRYMYSVSRPGEEFLKCKLMSWSVALRIC